MKIFPLFLVSAGFLALLSGCSSAPTTARSSLVACQSLTATAQTLAAVKPKLSARVQTEVGQALNAAAAYCLTPNPPANANQAVAGILGTLNALAAEVGSKP